MRCPRSPRLLLLVAALALLLGFAFAQDERPASDRNAWMGRFSAVEGEVSYRRAAGTEQYWFDAAVNTPLGEDDQVFTSRSGRAEIQLTGRNIVRLDADTSFKITQFTTDFTQLSLQLGTATFRVDSLDRRQFQLVDARDLGNETPLYFEVNTPTLAVTLLKTGVYRVTVREDGTTEVAVQRGEAEVYNRELGTRVISQGRRILVEGDDPNSYQMAKLRERDAWDKWNEQRDNELAYQHETARSTRYVPVGVPGVYDLDRYGDWYDTPDYGYVWTPRLVATGWAPYRAGYWNWYPGYGWTWVSAEAWGWAPYHYGRWAYYRNRWCWVPRDSFSVGFSWAPALVTFFGYGGGYGSGYRDGFSDGYRRGVRDANYGWVGWVPLAPGERYYRSRTNVVGNNTTINNYGSARLHDYRNYAAPGGVTGIDGRRFTSHRVAVNSNGTNNITPLPGGNANARSVQTVRGDVIRPVVSAAQLTEPQSIRPAVTRAATNRVITRGVVPSGNAGQPTPSQSGLVQPGTTSPTGPGRSIENGLPTLRGAESGRRGESRRDVQPSGSDSIRREAPAGGAVTPPAQTGSENTPPRKVERPRRNTRPDARSDARPPFWSTAPHTERPPQEVVRPAERTRPVERQIERPSPPSRPTESYEPRRIERPAPRNEPRYERPSAPPRETPRPEPRNEPRNESRPAPRPEAPRHVERPSAPPRETSRPERSAPSDTQPSRNFGGRRIQ